MNTDGHRYRIFSKRPVAGYKQSLDQLSVFTCVHLWLILLFFPTSVHPQIRPVYDQGALGLGRLLKRLNTSASALMIGAHPDDEDTALLAYLARGENARTAYLSLTRGDGGQNIIGPELGEALGVIRTEELLQARKLDGAEQYFTRAYDYGFSKTLAEAKSKWDEKIILCDVVRVIREFRPLVVISQFSGTSADGHGQHQFAGYISPLAVKAAADPTQCNDAGTPWEVKKFYVRHRGQGEPTLRINTGKYDPLLGRSYFEIAMEARSQHKSQEQGVLELRGDQYSGLNLVGGGERETSIFDGIKRPPTSELRSAIESVIKEVDLGSPDKSIASMTRAYDLAFRNLRRTDLNDVDKKEATYIWGLLSDAIVVASGIQIDALAERDTVVRGESINISAKAFVPDGSPVRVRDLKLVVPDSWSTESVEAPKANTPAFVTRENANLGAIFKVTASPDQPVTQPYWLEQPRDGDLFRWDREKYDKTFPLQLSEMSLLATLQIDGQWLGVIRPVEFRYADDIRGEIRRPLSVVPLVSISVEPDLLMFARGTRSVTKEVSVTVTNNSTGPVSGRLSLGLPSRWSSAPQQPEFALSKKGESTSVRFVASIPAGAPPGSYSINASAMVGSSVYSKSMRTIAYPHIQTHRIYSDAAVKANIVDLRTEPLKIGYIPGSGDRVPQAIAQMGLTVETIDERTLASGDLSRFDVIVVGIRAYQVRADIVAHNKRLLDFANAGGTLVVQYQLPGYTQQNLAPFPAQQGPRVSDETAKVTVVDPMHPIFNTPNKITDSDFDGWVQERNLYNFSTMDAKFIGLLESHDANEAENKGGLVVADVGKGKYIYCSYSLFRQLPAGVPGAYRLLANMLAYGQTKRK